MTEVNGPRLVYRGCIAGLTGAYVWMAVAMLLAIPAGIPLEPVRILGSIGPEGWGATINESFLLALALAQVAGGAIGIGFAYFFARFFTVRATLAIAALCFSLLSWTLLSERLAVAVRLDGWQVGTWLILIVATICYGLILGSAVPVRGEVMRAHVPGRIATSG